MYDKEFRKKQKGKISIVLNADWHFPRRDENIFLKAAKRGMEFNLGWFANPIYVNGDYPEVMKTLIEEHSRLEGIDNRYGERKEGISIHWLLNIIERLEQLVRL